MTSRAPQESLRSAANSCYRARWAGKATELQLVSLARDVLEELGPDRPEEEDCIVFETVQDDGPEVRASARATAAKLRHELGQEAVGLVFSRVDFELV